jgi:hypothetical protein
MSIIIGVLFNVVGLGVFRWALFALATQALPFFIGMTAGIYSYQTRAGPGGRLSSPLLQVVSHSCSATRVLCHPLACCSPLAVRDSGGPRWVRCDRWYLRN